MKKARRKYPDRLADSCKRSSVNWMAAGSRLSWCIMDFLFIYLLALQHTYNLICTVCYKKKKNITKYADGPLAYSASGQK